jgi:hypothetical protein
MGMPFLAALDAPESLVECAENESSIPASERHFFIHLAIVEEPTAQSSFLSEVKKRESDDGYNVLERPR